MLRIRNVHKRWKVLICLLLISLAVIRVTAFGAYRKNVLRNQQEQENGSYPALLYREELGCYVAPYMPAILYGEVISVLQELYEPTGKCVTVGYRVKAVRRKGGTDLFADGDIVIVHARYVRQDPETEPAELRAGDRICVSFVKARKDEEEYAVYDTGNAEHTDNAYGLSAGGSISLWKLGDEKWYEK